jgi:hypothetical protein
MAAYLIEDRILCEPCARAHFGTCPEHQQPGLECCAEYGASTYAAGQAAIRASRNPDGTRTCGACGQTFQSNLTLAGSLPPDDPVFEEPPRIYSIRESGLKGEGDGS